VTIDLVGSTFISKSGVTSTTFKTGRRFHHFNSSAVATMAGSS
jgi:hypothetical protein